ncbi:MAG: ABC-type transport auxiliary lipoprotein family protein [Alphaproteobacteria bacterium]|nr:ABC-type transport auxiliary lipoprotein family protein [Alphaproteobacteria bacterium]
MTEGSKHETTCAAAAAESVMIGPVDRRRAMAGLSGGVAALGLAGCSVELPGSGEQARVFVLSPKSTFGEETPAVDWQLLIAPPEAAAGLDTVRIALRQTEIELQYFAGAAWTDTATKMVERLLIESFENSGKIVSVGRQAVGLRANFILVTDLREFQAEYEGKGPGEAPDVRIRLNAKLVKMPQRVIVSSQTVERVAPAAGSDLIGVVRGFDEALGKVMKRLVEWTLAEGQTHIADT